MAPAMGKSWTTVRATVSTAAPTGPAKVCGGAGPRSRTVRRLSEV